MIKYIRGFFLPILFIAVLSSCGSPDALPQKSISDSAKVMANIQKIKQDVQAGDLLLRCGDDLMSQQIKNLNENEKTFSHAGIIAEHNGTKMVCHIYPDEVGADTIKYEALDSFLSPAKNLNCGLYRYDFSPDERNAFIKTFQDFKLKDVRFDKVYDVLTDDKMYCSEMIAKGLATATHQRIIIKTCKVPQRMQKLVTAYFKSLGGNINIIAAREMYSLDNLYLIKGCTQIETLPLKYFPAQ